MWGISTAQVELFGAVSAQTWTKAWVVHSKSVGSGVHAFKYLAPCVKIRQGDYAMGEVCLLAKIKTKSTVQMD